ncbi:tRNA pseudouridine38-40 synthase [Garciella nitratireducens DSM 15102]|uniref:tRNA pseudouridine synthase A n=2 Tax=Garciella TaxID=218204 RepID=A0A1T4PQF6_9FIRM|nr:tRNA pseudouridine38-40 synthase [Garciella nitratireducens DSM 15102]
MYSYTSLSYGDDIGMKRNIQILLEYDGSNYHGWQRQNNALTIQEKLEEAIQQINHEEVTIIGSSRTDSGVHARGQSANFYTQSKIPIDKIPYAMNSKLPKDIRVYKAIERPLEFHSRYHAVGKKYSYHIQNTIFPSALEYNRTWHIAQKLNIQNMKKANKFFIGTHDFAAFQASGSSVKTSIRTITFSKLIHKDEKVILEIEGNGFLYNMVRIIIGTLVEVGIGKISFEEIPDIINSKDRNRAGMTAPPYGLYLEKVFYE